MKIRVGFTCLLLGSAVGLLGGCTIGSVIWTSEATEELKVDTAGLTGLDVQTHNGDLTYAGKADHAPEAVVTVLKKGGGATIADAEAAREAIEVYVESAAPSIKRIAWRWKTPKQLSWGACVGYRISAPARLSLTGTSHNGAIEASGIVGEVSLESYNGHIKLVDTQGKVSLRTHNGHVEARSSGGPLHAESYNGRVIAEYAGDEIELRSHNGEITAELGRCGAVHGEIVSYNGDIELTLGQTFAADVDCESYNGRIKSRVPWEVSEMSRGKAVGRIGAGGGKLGVTTHNGSIRIEPAK